MWHKNKACAYCKTHHFVKARMRKKACSNCKKQLAHVCELWTHVWTVINNISFSKTNQRHVVWTNNKAEHTEWRIRYNIRFSIVIIMKWMQSPKLASNVVLNCCSIKQKIIPIFIFLFSRNIIGNDQKWLWSVALTIALLLTLRPSIGICSSK